MRKIIWILSSLAWFVASNTTSAQQLLPNDTDLKASYCIRHFQQQIRFMDDSLDTLKKNHEEMSKQRNALFNEFATAIEEMTIQRDEAKKEGKDEEAAALGARIESLKSQKTLPKPDLDSLQHLDSSIQIDSQTIALTETSVANDRDKLNHLRSYLVPRMKYLSSEALHAAYLRADSDTEKVDSPKVEQCMEPCKRSDKQEISTCIRACSPEALGRIWACNDLSWLPF